jgi:hypothetical protein
MTNFLADLKVSVALLLCNMSILFMVIVSMEKFSVLLKVCLYLLGAQLSLFCAGY